MLKQIPEISSNKGFKDQRAANPSAEILSGSELRIFCCGEGKKEQKLLDRASSLSCCFDCLFFSLKIKMKPNNKLEIKVKITPEAVLNE